MIFKKGDYADYNLPLTSRLSKLIEILIHACLYLDLENM